MDRVDQGFNDDRQEQAGRRKWEVKERYTSQSIVLPMLNHRYLCSNQVYCRTVFAAQEALAMFDVFLVL